MSGMLLVIGNKNYSSWSLRPWVFLKQNQIDFDEKRIALFTDTTDDELSQYNSDCKVPVLKDGDLIIWDSLAILEYLSEVYLGSRGWPEDAEARAFARSVSCEMHSSFFNVRGEMPMNCRKRFQNIRLSSEAEREVERIKFLWRQCRTRYGRSGDWLFGEYSIADAMFAPIVLRLDGYGVMLEGIEKQYTQTVLQQACMIEWMEAGKQEAEIIQGDEINSDDYILR